LASEKGLKIAISGKGGVGKTTLAALLVELFAEDSQRVLAVDADPDANLGAALGFTQEELANLIPIAQHRELIKERTGAEPGASGQMFRLNPKVEDIPDKMVLSRGNIRFLQMGTVSRGGGGCACPESVLLKHLLRHLVVSRGETLIVDMEAGLEHLGRGTAQGVDAFIVVVEPGLRSIQTARDVIRLGQDLGVTKVFGVLNKVLPEQEERLKQELNWLPLLGILPFDPAAGKADLEGKRLKEESPRLVAGVQEIKKRLKELLLL
jgi:CO dehydrogenase maturation factor